MWKREMTCLLSVCNYIVEFVPAPQNLQNKPSMEVQKITFCNIGIVKWKYKFGKINCDLDV
ncbi:putative PRONE domain, Rop guanine nucleotide exchange factor [Helianthus anomalus]